jgi:hypothetical protein
MSGQVRSKLQALLLDFRPESGDFSLTSGGCFAEAKKISVFVGKIRLYK